MVKVLHIITRLDMGGSAQNTLHTCIGLAGKYKMILAHGLSLESGMTDLEQADVEGQIQKAETEGVRFYSIASLIRRVDPVEDIHTLWRILRIIRRENPTIVHTHSSKAGIIGRWAAWFSRVPIIVHTAHGHVFYGHFGTVVSKLFLAIEKLTAPITDLMIALTEGERQDYLEYKLCPIEKTVTIHSGVDIRKFNHSMPDKGEAATFAGALGLKSTGLVIGTVGWLLPIKGPMVLLEAMERVWRIYPDAQLVYVGKGDLLGELKARVERSNAGERVYFLGWRDDIHKVMTVFDLFVLPSLNEGMGRVLVEAMACGKPLIASDTGGIPDLLKHDRNGLLVPPGDAEKLADAILKLLGEPERAVRMGVYGREFCRQFSIEAMLQKIDQSYQKLLVN